MHKARRGKITIILLILNLNLVNLFLIFLEYQSSLIHVMLVYMQQKMLCYNFHSMYFKSELQNGINNYQTCHFINLFFFILTSFIAIVLIIQPIT